MRRGENAGEFGGMGREMRRSGALPVRDTFLSDRKRGPFKAGLNAISVTGLLRYIGQLGLAST